MNEISKNQLEHYKHQYKYWLDKRQEMIDGLHEAEQQLALYDKLLSELGVSKR